MSTLKDIAKELGVSVTTVSRALNDKPDISAEMKQRVVEKAQALGYVSNTLARQLRTQRTNTIGVVISDNANPFFAHIVRGIQDTALTHGYHIVLCNTDEDYDKEIEAIRILRQMQVAGIIINPTQAKEQSMLDLIGSKVPFVLINRYFDEIDTNFVVGNDVAGGYLATEHLLSQGFSEIWNIAGPLRISPARDRLRGYQRALADSGIEYDERLVVSDCIDMNDGYYATGEILDRAEPPIAVCCFSDYVAVGAMDAILEAGLAIPEDVRLVGYDDIEFAPYLRVPLTTIDNPRYTVGETAVNVLVDIIDQSTEAETNHVVLEPKLVIRSSA